MFVRVMNAAIKLIENKNWKILSENYAKTPINIVARDESGDIHMVQIGYKNSNEKFNIDYYEREQIENEAISWCDSYNDYGYTIHFDHIEMTVMKNGYGFVKAHYDYLS